MHAPTALKPRTRLPLLLTACVAALLLGCTSRYVMTDRGPQAYYQTGFPLHDTSQDLERIFRSVKRIQVTAYYTTHRFARDDRITESDIRQRATYRRAVESFTFDHTKAGTATIIARTPNGLRLITNEHTTRLPDTLVVYYGDPREVVPDPQAPRYVESVSIKTAQTSLVLGLPDAVAFRVAARDSASDIALLGVDLVGNESVHAAEVLRVRSGDAARLAWGSFVYVLGYPRGYKMVTRGIVSDPNRRPDNSFLLDGLFNRGISGGLILAVRGDTGELEWVGMANATSAQAEAMLMPERRQLDEDGMLLPYEGRLYMEQVARIDYGITFSVPITAIQRFMRAAGYYAAGPPH
jgi:hypothetical protein